MIIMVLVCIALVLIGYYFYKFISFKTELMNAFGTSGISYEIANDIYTIHAKTINKLHFDGLSPEAIVKIILLTNPDVIIQTIKQKLAFASVPLIMQEIDCIKNKSKAITNINGVKFVYSDIGLFYRIKGDAFIMVSVSADIFEKIWDLMKMNKESPLSAYHEARLSNDIKVNFTITALQLKIHVYHVNMQILFKDNKDEEWTVPVGATAQKSLDDIFKDIHELLLGKLQWSDTTQEALSKIGQM